MTLRQRVEALEQRAVVHPPGRDFAHERRMRIAIFYHPDILDRLREIAVAEDAGDTVLAAELHRKVDPALEEICEATR